MTYTRLPHAHASILSALTALVLAACLSSAAPGSVTLPPLFDPDDALQPCDLDAGRQGVQAHFGVSAVGDNNLRSLWDITEDGQPPASFVDSEAYAVLGHARWLCVSIGDWSIGCGRGAMDSYYGNNDAGQLWLDIHSEGPTRGVYEPTADQQSIAVSWYGIGRTARFRNKGIRASADIWLRQIVAEDYLARAITGSLAATPRESFSGMIRIVDSGEVYRNGWALDIRALIDFGKGWECAVSAEGLLGRIRFDEMFVEDGSFTSAEVFMDPEGFLHDYGGITGAAWRENASVRIEPLYRAEIVRRGRVDLMIAFEDRARARRTQSVGAAIRRDGGWIPYARYYPSQDRFEIGAIGRNWRFRISGDDWPGAAPRRLQAALSAVAISF